jgi:hypothetical protein
MAMTDNKMKPLFAQTNRPRRAVLSVLGLALLAALCAGCAAARQERQAGTAVPATEQSAEETRGIKALAVRLTANGNMLDFRYQVLDPDRALPLFSRDIKPYLVDEATGTVCVVPDVPKIGAVRSTTRTPVAGQEHFILFVNPNRFVKSGSKVTVVIGDFRKANLVVE